MTPAQMAAEVLRLRHLHFGNRFDEAISAEVYRHEADAIIRALAAVEAERDALGQALIDAEDIAEALRAARADLSRLAAAARAVLAVEWDMVDPQHRTFAHQFPEMLDAIRRLRDVVEGLENDNLLQGARREPHARLRRQWSMAGARGVVGSQG